uniref:C2H2-type domain-containing protein n=1 Tax=Pygocentrus nattereri TaxID=42514 RepID=A0AAR2J6T5_PYGNA
NKSEVIEVESAEEGDDPSVWDSDNLTGRRQALQRYPSDSTVEHFNNVNLPTSSQSQLTSDFPGVASTSSAVQDMDNWHHAKGLNLYQPRAGRPRNERVPHEKLFSCNYCGKAFNRPKKVEIHQRIHTGEKPFRCMTCGKFFAEAGNLKKHQKVHTGERPYSCTHCGKTFAWIRNLKTHQQKYHSDVFIVKSLKLYQNLSTGVCTSWFQTQAIEYVL